MIAQEGLEVGEVRQHTVVAARDRGVEDAVHLQAHHAGGARHVDRPEGARLDPAPQRLFEQVPLAPVEGRDKGVDGGVAAGGRRDVPRLLAIYEAIAQAVATSRIVTALKCRSASRRSVAFRIASARSAGASRRAGRRTGVLRPARGWADMIVPAAKPP